MELSAHSLTDEENKEYERDEEEGEGEDEEEEEEKGVGEKEGDGDEGGDHRESDKAVDQVDGGGHRPFIFPLI